MAINLDGLWSWITGSGSEKLSGAPEDEPTRMKIEWGEGGNTAGQVVNQRTVLGIPTAWACIRTKSQVVGSMGMQVFSKSADGGRKEEPNHWLSELVHDEPNADQTASEFWAGQIACIDLWGNAYAEKMQIGSRVAALTPLRPDRMHVVRNRDGSKTYLYLDRGQVERLPADKVFHLRGLTLGGDEGLSPVQFGRQSMGTAIASSKTAGATFANGLHISGFMETGAHTLKQQQRQDLIEIFSDFTGKSMAGKILPLEKDFKFVPLTMNPADAQLLESRRWDVEELCRWYDMYPILIGHSAEGQTMWGSGIEQILLGWQTLRLNPLLRNIEQAVRKQLLPAGERKRVYPEINREALMAADSAARAALYSQLAQNGVMTRGEIRRRENLPPMPGDDVLTVQSNLIALDQLGKQPSAEQQARAALLHWLGQRNDQDAA